MRLKPVTERSPQHARSRARRAAFHDVVLAIKEIRGISGIERHRRESVEWLELCPRPFPAIADQVVNAKGARAARIGAHRRRVPMRKIKIAVARAGKLVSPGVLTLDRIIRSSVRGAMKLRFGGKL